MLTAIWPKAKQLLASQRGAIIPEDQIILAHARRLAARKRIRIPENFSEALSSHPKELLEGLLWHLRLKRSAALYEMLGSQVSLPLIKSAPDFARLAGVLESWFSRQASI